MSKTRTSTTSLALVALLAAIVLTGCAGSDTLLGPDPNAAAVTVDWAWEECPGWEEACDQGRQEICFQCPPDADWKNPGQYNSCIRKALRQYLQELSDCFSNEELDTLRDCILDENWESIGDQEVNRKQKFRDE
ncbi:MAG: hypothetical protein JSW58_15170 [Candidatus Latescibacterota bacterium]|nr:MAG: hypothetical protein JSW58_15170 [Candidatus Latescibacterota bacterium]